MEWTTTTTILDQLRRDDAEPAWHRLVDRFRAPVLSFVRRMGLSQDDAEDVTQETLSAFVEGLRKNRYDRTKGRLSSWLFGIAYRQSLSARQRLAARERHAPADGSQTAFLARIPDEDTATTSWDEEWARSVLQSCMDQVRQEVEPRTFLAFELTALAKQPPARVASQLGISRNAVFVAKHRVLKRLGELREEYEGIR